MIDESILRTYTPDLIVYSKGDIIFSEGQYAKNYYQILSGQVKMNNFNDEGKEFTQGIFLAGQSFGEPPLFVDVQYPANAEALTNCKLYRLGKSQLLQLLEDHPKEHLKITQTLAGRLYYKAIMASELSSQEPEHRILRIIDYLKTHVHHVNPDEIHKIDLTRQQIADLTGLRVETVIRACKVLAEKEEIQIIKRKIYR